MLLSRVRSVAAVGAAIPHRPRRNGFTTIELLVVVAIVASLAAVVLPRVTDYVVRGRAAALAQSLDALVNAIMAFRSDVGRFPQQLVSLGAPLTASSTDVCSTPSVPRYIPEQNRKAWRGPYVARVLGPAGIVSGTATIQDTVRRTPMDPTQFGRVLVNVNGVDQKIAEELERVLDGRVPVPFSGDTTGTIRWVDEGGRRGKLSYAIPAVGC